MSNGRKAIPPGPPWGKANGCSAMTSLVRRRVVLSFSRDLEFATETELGKRMGPDGPLFGKPTDGALTPRGSWALRRYEAHQ